MVVGEMAGIIHRERRRSFWEFLFDGEMSPNAISDRNWKSYQIAMSLAGKIALREAKGRR